MPTINNYAVKYAKPVKTADAVNRAAINNLVAAAIAAAGAGAAFGGAKGLYDKVRRNTRGHIGPRPEANLFTLPMPRENEEDKYAFDKAAEGEEGKGWLMSLMTGGTPKKPGDLTWYHPALLATVPAAGYGGYKAVDWLMGKRKNQEQDESLERAKRQFADAIAGQYGKTASDHSLAADLDELCEKVGVDENFEKRAINPLAMYLTYALASGGLAGLTTYGAASRNNKAKARETAMKLRQRRNYSRRPSPVFAVPGESPKDDESQSIPSM